MSTPHLKTPGSVPKESSLLYRLWALTVPALLTQLAVPVASSVDIILMGHESANAMQGAGLGAVIIAFLFWNVSHLRMSGAALSARVFGQAKGLSHETDRVLSHILMRARNPSLGLTLVTTMTGLILLLASRALNNEVGSAHALYQSALYALILALGAAGHTLTHSLSGFMSGTQRPKVLLLTALIQQTLNILVSLVLVKCAGLGIVGVAFGSALAHWVPPVAILFILGLRPRAFFKVFMNPKRFSPSPFAGENFDAIVIESSQSHSLFAQRTFALSLMFLFFHWSQWQKGQHAYNAALIFLNLFFWVSYFFDALATSAEALMGQFLGQLALGEHSLQQERDALACDETTQKITGETREDATFERIRDAIQELQKKTWMSTLFAQSLCVFALLLGKHLLPPLFTNQQAVLNLIEELWFWVVVIPIACPPAFILDGFHTAELKAKAMRDAMLVALALTTPLFLYASQSKQMSKLTLGAFILFFILRATGQAWIASRQNALSL